LISPRVAVIAAMKQELRPFVRMLSLRRLPGRTPPLWGGRVGRVEVVAGITTMGTDAAREFTEGVLRSYEVDHVIGIGIAGGIGPSVDIGDLLVPEVVVDDESGAEHRPVPIDGHTPRGTLLTSDALVSDKRSIPQLVDEGVIAVDMETSAIGAVCEREGVPWSVLRAISDRASDEAIDDAVVGLARADGSADVGAVLRFLVTRPGKVPHLATLARGMSAATRTSAAAAARACANF
jgi:adenosylhomocysteine nucleosidase